MTTTITRRRVGLGIAGLASLLGSGCLGSITGDDEHEHEHDDPPWEWGGLHELEAGTYSYAYREGPDPDMLLALLPGDDGGDHGLFHAGETATELFEAGEPESTLADGDTAHPSSDALYRLEFGDDGETTIELDLESDGYYAIFTEHVPAEFDAELRSESGDEIRPDATERHSDHDHGESETDHEH